MTKQNYGILLALALCGCETDRRLGGEMVQGAGSGGVDATDAIKGTTALTAGGGNTGRGSSARSSGTVGGGTGTSNANAAGGTTNDGTVDPGTGASISSGAGGTSGAPRSDSASTGTFGGSTGGLLAGGSRAGGASNGGTGGLLASGAPNGGASNGASNGGASNGASNGGASIGGTSNGGTSIGGTSNGGTSIGGTSNGGASAGGTGGCVPVCSLYGAPCCLWETACLGPTGGCTIDVLASSVSITYDYGDLETKIAALPQDVSVSLTDQDFSWVAADPWPAGRFELHLTEAAAARTGAILDEVRDNRAFRVSCGGKALFVGVVYLIYGAAALQTPVLHHARENDVLVLRLGAIQGEWLFGPSDECGTPCQRIDRLELRAAFCRLGVMHELAPDARPLNP